MHLKNKHSVCSKKVVRPNFSNEVSFSISPFNDLNRFDCMSFLDKSAIE